MRNPIVLPLALAALTCALPSNAQTLAEKPLRALVITGGHDFDPSFFGIFDACKEIGSLTKESPEALKTDLRDRCDVLILYNANADLDDATRKNLEAFVAAGKGLVVMHHALLDYQASPWWANEVVGGSYCLNVENGRAASTYLHDVAMDVTPTGDHPVLKGVKAFHTVDEGYKGMVMAAGIQPLLTVKADASDPVVAWVGPCKSSRVVAIQLGHGPSIFADPTYRALVRNAIVWTAGREP